MIYFILFFATLKLVDLASQTDNTQLFLLFTFGRLFLVILTTIVSICYMYLSLLIAKKKSLGWRNILQIRWWKIVLSFLCANVLVWVPVILAFAVLLLFMTLKLNQIFGVLWMFLVVPVVVFFSVRIFLRLSFANLIILDKPEEQHFLKKSQKIARHNLKKILAIIFFVSPIFFLMSSLFALVDFQVGGVSFAVVSSLSLFILIVNPFHVYKYRLFKTMYQAKRDKKKKRETTI